MVVGGQQLLLDEGGGGGVVTQMSRPVGQGTLHALERIVGKSLDVEIRSRARARSESSVFFLWIL